MKNLDVQYKQLLVWVKNLQFGGYITRFQAEPVVQSLMQYNEEKGSVDKMRKDISLMAIISSKFIEIF